MKRIILALLVISLVTPISIIAQSGKRNSGGKPKWIKNTSSLNEKRSNDSYTFEMITIHGDNLQDIMKLRVNELAGYIGQKNQIKTTSKTDIQNIQDGSQAISKIVFNNTTTNNSETDVFFTKLVDDYWEYNDSRNGGAYIYYALYAVSKNNQMPIFDDFSTTTSYGAAPVLMSIIPGAGQMYKGSTVKGLCLLGGTAALVVGALFCDNERADYKNKMKEQPQFAQTYNTKANNYETARNICLGGAAAVWLYNIIDAAYAKGKRRIVVKPGSSKGFTLAPIISPTEKGVMLAYHF